MTRATLGLNYPCHTIASVPADRTHGAPKCVFVKVVVHRQWSLNVLYLHDTSSCVVRVLDVYYERAHAASFLNQTLAYVYVSHSPQWHLLRVRGK